jgi:hypothetical protein
VEHKEQPFFWFYFNNCKPPRYGDWSEPDYPATAVHDVPQTKLNLDLRVLDDVVLMSRDDREAGLAIANRHLTLGAGRPSGGLLGSLFGASRRTRSQTLLGIIFDGEEKYQPSWEGRQLPTLNSITTDGLYTYAKAS